MPTSPDTRAPAPVTKPGFFEVTTPDPDRLVHYYTDALDLVVTERSGSATYLTTGVDHHCVIVRQGEPNGRAAIGFEVAGSLTEVQRDLKKLGVDAELRSDPQPEIRAALALPEPETATPIYLYQGQEPSGVPNSFGIRPTKLGHIASYVEDLEGAQSFYTDVLGFRWSDTIGDFFTFLRCNADHHAINLMRSVAKHGLFHVAFEMRDIVHLKDALDHLAAREIRLQWGPGRHGAGHNIFTYHHDPDGNLVELFTEIDIIYDEATGQFQPRPWHEHWPQVPQFWGLGPGAANKWGPIDPEMMEH
jgi:catechol-2,3-dioxygenase